MLEANDHAELSDRPAEVPCAVEIPRALQQRLARRGAQDATFDERRQFARFAFLSKTLLEVATSFKCVERPREHFTILTTDVSRDGVAFLHVQQLYPGELVTVWFPTCKVACRVTRCLKHNAKCYEIGASFEDGPRPQTWIRAIGGQPVTS
ncbi:MAG TPA: PilZ domain-containing protein [Planctomycetaceae bacterium]|jgi:hypothetical protein|nr:PilZ domain-containing protein [Planctomycetaceae bacterium]